MVNPNNVIQDVSKIVAAESSVTPAKISVRDSAREEETPVLSTQVADSEVEDMLNFDQASEIERVSTSLLDDLNKGASFKQRTTFKDTEREVYLDLISSYAEEMNQGGDYYDEAKLDTELMSGNSSFIRSALYRASLKRKENNKNAVIDAFSESANPADLDKLLNETPEGQFTEDTVKVFIARESAKALLAPHMYNNESLKQASERAEILSSAKKEAELMRENRSTWTAAGELGLSMFPGVETVDLRDITKKVLKETNVLQGSNYTDLNEAYFACKSPEEAQQFIKDIQNAIIEDKGSLEAGGFLYTNILDNLSSYSINNHLVDSFLTLLDIPLASTAKAVGVAAVGTAEGLRQLKAMKSLSGMLYAKGNSSAAKRALSTKMKDPSVAMSMAENAQDIEASLPSILKQDSKEVVKALGEKVDEGKTYSDVRSRVMMESATEEEYLRYIPTESYREDLKKLMEGTQFQRNRASLETVYEGLVQQAGETATREIRDQVKDFQEVTSNMLKGREVDVSFLDKESFVEGHLLTAKVGVTYGIGHRGDKSIQLPEKELRAFLKKKGFSDLDYDLVTDTGDYGLKVRFKKDLNLSQASGEGLSKQSVWKTLFDTSIGQFLFGSTQTMDKKANNLASSFEGGYANLMDTQNRIMANLSKLPEANLKMANKLLNDAFNSERWMKAPELFAQGVDPKTVEAYEILRAVSDINYIAKNDTLRSSLVQSGYKETKLTLTPKMQEILQAIDPKGDLNLVDSFVAKEVQQTGKDLTDKKDMAVFDFSTGEIKRAANVKVDQDKFALLELPSSVKVSTPDNAESAIQAMAEGREAASLISFIVVPKKSFRQGALRNEVLNYRPGDAIKGFKNFIKMPRGFVDATGTHGLLTDVTFGGARTWEEAVLKQEGMNKILKEMFETGGNPSTENITKISLEHDLMFQNAAEVGEFLREKNLFEAASKGERFVVTDNAIAAIADDYAAVAGKEIATVRYGKHIDGFTGGIQRSYRSKSGVSDLKHAIGKETVDNFSAEDLNKFMTQSIEFSSKVNTIDAYRTFMLDRIRTELSQIRNSIGMNDIQIPMNDLELMRHFDELIPKGIALRDSIYPRIQALKINMDTLKRQLNINPQVTFQESMKTLLKGAARKKEGIFKYLPGGVTSWFSNLEMNGITPVDWAKSWASLQQFAFGIDQVVTQGMASMYAGSVHPLFASKTIKLFNLAATQDTLRLNPKTYKEFNIDFLRKNKDVVGLKTLADIEALTEQMKYSGISQIGNSHIYNPEYTTAMLGSFKRKFTDSSMVFMDVGNNIAKTVGFMTAVQEMAEKTGKGFAKFTKAEWSEVQGKGMLYSGNMTKMKRGVLQDGVLGLATMWQGQSFRALEMLVSPASALSGKERAAMAMSQLALFGSRGVLGDKPGIRLASAINQITGENLSAEDQMILEDGLLTALVANSLGINVNFAKYGTQVFNNQLFDAFGHFISGDPQIAAGVMLDLGQYNRLTDFGKGIAKSISTLMFDDSEFKTDRFLYNIENTVKTWNFMDKGLATLKALSLGRLYNRNYHEISSVDKEGKVEFAMKTLMNLLSIQGDKTHPYTFALYEMNKDTLGTYGDPAVKELTKYIRAEYAKEQGFGEDFIRDVNDWSYTVMGVFPTTERQRVIQKVMNTLIEEGVMKPTSFSSDNLSKIQKDAKGFEQVDLRTNYERQQENKDFMKSQVEAQEGLEDMEEQLIEDYKGRNK